jgi:hypothetical protein
MADPGKVSVSIRGRSAKIGTMAARLAIAAAKQNGDPIFDRYTGIRKKMGKLKHMLLLKYGHVGMKKALTIMDGDKR